MQELRQRRKWKTWAHVPNTVIVRTFSADVNGHWRRGLRLRQLVGRECVTVSLLLSLLWQLLSPYIQPFSTCLCADRKLIISHGFCLCVCMLLLAFTVTEVMLNTRKIWVAVDDWKQMCSKQLQGLCVVVCSNGVQCYRGNGEERYLSCSRWMKADRAKTALRLT